MIDINQYDYGTKSFTKNNKFHIQPLTSTGKMQYYAYDSHCHKFKTNRIK